MHYVPFYVTSPDDILPLLPKFPPASVESEMVDAAEEWYNTPSKSEQSS